MKKIETETDDGISIIQTTNMGYLISIQRSIKIGKTADEITKIKLEGYAPELFEAKTVLESLDRMTHEFILKEAEFYQIPLPPGSIPAKSKDLNDSGGPYIGTINPKDPKAQSPNAPI